MNSTIGPNKAIAAGVSGVAAGFLIWLLNLTGVTMPAEVAEAVVVAVGTLFTWLVPHGGKS